MDLSKVYDCLTHDLLIAKLEAYALDMASLSLLKIQKSSICNFAYDNTLYSCSQVLQTVIENYDVKNVLTWFKINSMKANSEKFQFMIPSKTRHPEYNLLTDSNVIK